MEAVLVVSCSSTDASSKAAKKHLCSRYRCAYYGEIEGLEPKRQPAGRLRHWFDSLPRRSRANQHLGPSPRDFNLVVSVSPSSAAQLARTMCSVPVRVGELPDIALISVVPGGGVSGAAAELLPLTGHVPLITAPSTSRERGHESGMPRLLAFAAAPRMTLARAHALARPAWGARHTWAA